MARFVIHIDKRKRQKEFVRGCSNMALSLFFIWSLIYYFNREGETLRSIFYICAIVQWAWLSIEHFQKSKREELFVQVTEQNIEWLMNEIGEPIVIDWDDIRWIKYELTDGITFSIVSSFSHGFSTKQFSLADKDKLLGELAQIATQKQIRFINFSEPALAFA